MSYSGPKASSGVALDAITPVILFSTNSTGRAGWRCMIPVSFADRVYFMVVPNGTVPSKNDLLLKGDYCPLAGQTVVDGARADCDIYAVMASGTGTIYPKELF